MRGGETEDAGGISCLDGVLLLEREVGGDLD